MRLKKVKLAGFKSFVDPTNVAFPEQMTCIVGPNGCGKSNIIDAVRWVLGESSAKNLRGDDMTDVIFNGSTNRKPVGQASVELVFENTEGRVQGSLADRSEISIKRLVTRERKSNYYLNGTKCRRRDITDIFLGTGMGARSYSIIEQGMISRLIESKPQDLRVFLEEAAGISKYKERRKETESRIKKTMENLARLEDVRHEMARTIEKLRRQSESAIKYKEYKADERKLKAELALMEYDKLISKAESKQAEVSQKQVELEKFRSDSTSSETTIINLKVQRDEANAEYDKAQSAFNKTSTTLARIEQQIIDNKRQQESLKREIERNKQNINSSEKTLALETEEISALEFELNNINENLEIVMALVDEEKQTNDSISEQYRVLNEKWETHLRSQGEISTTKERYASKLRHSEQTISVTKSRLSSVEQELAELNCEEDNLDASVVSQIENTKHELSKIQEKLNSSKEKRLEYEARYNALNEEHSRATKTQNESTAKIESLRFIQLQEQEDVSHLEDWLKENNIEKSHCLESISVVDGWERAVEAAIQLWGNPIVVESNTIQTPEGIFSLVSKAQKKPTANSLASKINSNFYPDFFNSITAVEDPTNHKSDGLCISKDATWSSGNFKARPSNTSGQSYLEREKIITSLLEECEVRQSEIDISESACINAKALGEKQANLSEKLTEEFQAQNAQLIMAETQVKLKKEQIEKDKSRKVRLNEEQLQLKEKIEDLLLDCEEINEQLLELQNIDQESDMDNIERERATAASSLAESNSRLERSTHNFHEAKLKVQTTKTRIEGLRNSIGKTKSGLAQSQEDVDVFIAELEDLIIPLEEYLDEQSNLVKEHATVESKLQELRLASENISNELNDIEKGQLTTKQKEMEMMTNVEACKYEVEKYKLEAKTFSDQIAQLNTDKEKISKSIPTNANIDEWSEKLIRTLRMIEMLGAVNLAAVEDYEKEKEKKAYLDEQNSDLNTALETLNSAIAKIDKETRAKFKETFDSVNEGLQTLFPKVFGGGGAYLELTDNNLLDTGVTIMARPPGKKNSTIHLLSGGEKALTALSLVFSIFKLNPAPFCMLDEVDAPLDDVNVGRFCKLVQEMSSTVQFVYISHNKIAMEMAHQLAGVTMMEAGVSRLVAVDIEEASLLATE